MNPNTIEFRTSNNELHNTWVMKITADRRIEVNEDVEVTEAAKKVLETMQLMLNKQNRTWVDLTEQELNLIGTEWHFNLLETKDKNDLFAFVKNIQTKLKEKNT